MPIQREKLVRIESTTGAAHCFFCDLGDGYDRINQITILYFTTIDFYQHTCVSILKSLSVVKFKIPYLRLLPYDANYYYNKQDSEDSC